MVTHARTASRRRLAGWGFEGEALAPSPELLAWLEERLGEMSPLPALPPADIRAPAPRPLPHLPGGLSQELLDRFAHARGQGLTDLLRLRRGALPAWPDGVARPRDAAEVEQVLRTAAAAGVMVIPWGGGTSVTGGVNVRPGEAPVVTLDLEHLAGLEALDETSGLATFGAGTPGPEIEAALGAHGWTLGHFPQSWELSTLGGWVATRASGQESLGYGGISEMVAGLELVAPAGRLTLPPLPASAAGPDLRQLILGSEGRLGVVTRATVRLRRRPPPLTVEAAMLPSWEEGLEASRELVQEGVPLTLLRLSNAPETEVALAVGLAGHRRLAPLVQGWLALSGIRRGGGCLLLLGAAGDEPWLTLVHDLSRRVLRRHGGVALGRRPGRRWVEDRFRHPYLRDALLDRGCATDTLETAAPWSALPELAKTVHRALEGALEDEGEAVAALCHVSHPYRDGASLYFTFFFRCPADVERAVARWAAIKRAATEAVTAAGGTVSHHHGVGAWHAPWLGREIGEVGRGLLLGTAQALDPTGVLNPGVLLDSSDRLAE
jgi:alkyldihydroxyacetonephosphate synthase